MKSDSLPDGVLTRRLIITASAPAWWSGRYPTCRWYTPDDLVCEEPVVFSRKRHETNTAARAYRRVVVHANTTREDTSWPASEYRAGRNLRAQRFPNLQRDHKAFRMDSCAVGLGRGARYRRCVAFAHRLYTVNNHVMPWAQVTRPEALITSRATGCNGDGYLDIGVSSWGDRIDGFQYRLFLLR